MFLLVCQLFVYIFQSLEEKERKSTAHRDNLLREQRYLRRRLELLSTQVDAIHKRRSVSECSTSTVSSSHSSHSESGRSIFRLYLLRNFLLDDTRNFTLRLAYFNRFTKMIKNCSKKKVMGVAILNLAKCQNFTCSVKFNGLCRRMKRKKGGTRC